MLVFDVLSDPVRRRILELLAERARSSGDIVEVIRKEFGISQPAVSQHLKVLRECGFATVQNDAQRRMYSVDPTGFREVDDWLVPFRSFWTAKLEALATEVARGKKQRRRQAAPKPLSDRKSGVS